MVVFVGSLLVFFCRDLFFNQTIFVSDCSFSSPIKFCFLCQAIFWLTDVHDRKKGESDFFSSRLGTSISAKGQSIGNEKETSN